ncbi:MAG: site-specific DNA-methyltransferase, partial [Salinivirgaceae bacterium]|nr:site-specific DNA-methyltransferase [Salinivirgaceae bacterium]
MIKNIFQHNETLTPNSQTLEVLQAHFPQCFNKEGFFDVDKFKDLIKADVDITHEGYDLNFLGKNYAKLLASIDTTTVIQPDVEHNAKPENANSQNLYISGDNLDGLKHLLKSYTGAVKCIYIDPPYNTGSDGFVYNDKFNFTPQELIDKLSISEEQAQKIFDLTTKGRASHSAWLTFMYPRLLLARDLLTPDGVIFISIDDNEQANLKLICDSVFGEENFESTIIPIVNPGGRDYKQVAVTNEYLLCYSKSESSELNEIPKVADFSFNDSMGGYNLRELRNRNPK